jgi:retron-type reverse transcriptase
MTVEDALGWLREHREELLESIRSGKYKPQPVRRKEIPKPDGGVRKLGISTVVDRVVQQAIAQQLSQSLTRCSRKTASAIARERVRRWPF